MSRLVNNTLADIQDYVAGIEENSEHVNPEDEKKLQEISRNLGEICGNCEAAAAEDESEDESEDSDSDDEDEG